VSTKPVEQVRNDFNRLFTDRFVELGLNGKSIGENEFSLYTTMLLLRVPGPEIRVAITGTKEDQTAFNISVTPHVGTAIPFFAFIAVGGFSLCILIFNPGAITAENIIGSLVFAFIIPAASAFYTQVSKDRMREQFEKYFGLTDGDKITAS
jgi:hypothetical protein